MLESTILSNIRNTLGRLPYCRLFRNNCGVYKDPRGHVVRYGVPSTGGGADLIGWTIVAVTPEMLGRDLAVFTAIEVKSQRGRIRDKQENFIEQVREAGGIAGMCRSVEEAVALIEGGK